MDIRRTVDDDGLYLGHFERKEEAEEFIDEQVRRYIFTPNPKNMSINRLCREAKEQGINLYPNTFSRELKRRGVQIRNARPKTGTTQNRTMSFEENTLEQLEEYPRGIRSTMADLGLRIVLGLPTEDVIIFLPEETGETTLFFHKKRRNRIQLYMTGDVDMKFEQQLRKLLGRAEQNGIQEIIDYAERNGYRYYGGTDV